MTSPHITITIFITE